MSIVAPPEPPRPDVLEALIREARTRQRRRRLRGAAVVAAVAAIALSIWAAVPGRTNATRPDLSGSPRAAGIAPCSPAQLRISLPRRVAGLGHLNGDLRFTNVGGTECQVSGWPTVDAVEANGTAIRAERIQALWMAWALNWPRSRPDRPVLLARGGSADAEIDGADVPPGSRNACPAARWLRVTAPGGEHPATISAVWWRNGEQPVYYSLCGGIAVTRFFPPSALRH